MPRIAVVTPLFPIREAPHRGQAMYFTVREMQRWADIKVFCPLAVYPESRWLQPRSYRYRRADLSYSLPDIQTEYFEYGTLPVVGRALNPGSAYRAVLSRLQAWKPDLVLAYWVYPEGAGALRAARKLSVPIVLGARGSDLRRPPDAMSRVRMRRTVLGVDYFLTVSEELRRIALGFGLDPQRCRTIPNGVDSSLFHQRDRSQARQALGLSPQSRVVLYVGNLIPTKGLNELAAAYSEMAAQDPDVQLICIGEGSLRDQLENRFAATGLAGRVRFPGVKPPAEVAQWMAASTLLCLPSYSEGCPNVVVEALACGRPVVATSVGGTPEWIDTENGLLVPPAQVPPLRAALAQALSRAWDESAIARRFQRSWGQVAEETWDACRPFLHPPA